MSSDLVSAIIHGDTESVQELLILGHDPNSADEHGRSMLHLAVEHDHAHIVRLLLEIGVNPSAADRAGWTPLFRAVEVAADASQQLERPASTIVLSLLIEFGADVNGRVGTPPVNMSSRTPLQLALAMGNVTIASLLRAAGATA